MSLDFADDVGCVWVDYSASIPTESSKNHRFSDGFRRGAELNWFACTRLILDTKCGNGFSKLIVCLFCSYFLIKKVFNFV